MWGSWSAYEVDIDTKLGIVEVAIQEWNATGRNEPDNQDKRLQSQICGLEEC